MNVLSSAGRRGYGSSVRKPCTIKDKVRNQDDRLPDLDEISLAEVGLALESHLLAPRANQQRRWKSSFEGTAASSGRDVERHSHLPLSFCPTAAEISLSLEASRAQLGQAEDAKRHLMSTVKKPAGNMDNLGRPGFQIREFWPARGPRRAP